jgi:hypothetical protein
MVGAMNRSMATMSGAWLRRKLLHPSAFEEHGREAIEQMRRQRVAYMPIARDESS